MSLQRYFQYVAKPQKNCYASPLSAANNTSLFSGAVCLKGFGNTALILCTKSNHAGHKKYSRIVI